jgi:spore coat protein A, manganese oxidase
LSRSSRRSFLETAVGAGLGLGVTQVPGVLVALTTALQLNALELPPFVDALPLPETIRPLQGRVSITMREVVAPLHRDLPPAKLWSYAAGRHGPGSTNPLSPLIELRSHQAVEIEWVNLLPQRHLFTIDHSLHGCGPGIPDVRAVVHLHGARNRTRDDGYPEDWYLPGRSRVCHYPMQQDATALWYHDHAMGINRLNIYAGLAGMVLVRDAVEDSVELPRQAHEIPLILYDRLLTKSGQLLYPTSADPAHPWVSEFSGDALCVNGKVRPYLEVEPVLYRLRILNAANSRFYTLSLSSQQKFHQIGSDQGLLPAPVTMQRLVLAPGERADLLIDFRDLAGQKSYLLTGVQPMLEFRVATRTPSKQSRAPLPAKLRALTRIDPASAVRRRTITLNEFQDKVGNPTAMLLNRKYWHEPVSEVVTLNTTEIWEFVNLTEDTHPMHLHLVRFQILDRQAFDRFEYLMHGRMRYTAPPELPAAHELAWKDVVQCPGEVVTRIIIHFQGFTGRYLYHCHILEHEANDMMRPFVVVA